MNCRRMFSKLIASLTLVTASLLVGHATAQQQPEYPPVPEGFNFAGAWTSWWNQSAVQNIEPSPRQTFPAVMRPEPLLDPQYYVWDSWPLRNEDGSIAQINGWTVLFALTAPREGNTPGERHALAEWRYYLSRGEDWVPGGLVFPDETALGTRQWAGSAVYDDETGRVTFYYTALGDLPANPEGEPMPVPSTSPASAPLEEVYFSGAGIRTVNRGEVAQGSASDPTLVRQELVATSADVMVTDSGLRFVDFAPHEIILTADGEFYQTLEQTQNGPGLYIFRDPFYFQDPATGIEYLLFSAASAINPGPHAGVVGLAWKNRQGEWELLPPLLSAAGVNSQLERPNMIVQDGRYYLFVTSHGFSFAPDLDAPAGLYGFVSDSPNMRGHYLPLNDTGLVAANPPYAPQQLYSFLVLPGGQVLSYINYVNLGDVSLSEIKLQSREWQREHFGGTPAPIVDLTIEGDTALLTETVTPPGL